MQFHPVYIIHSITAQQANPNSKNHLNSLDDRDLIGLAVNLSKLNSFVWLLRDGYRPSTPWQSQS